jgi:SAM-dependent methyltransferase
VTYAFGDSDLARERLALVADTFAAPTRTFLKTLPPGDRRYVIDMGCGPGYTTALLRDAFPDAFITGVDASSAIIDEARVRAPSAQFTVGDVTAPLRLPAHVVFARLLLGHLGDPAGALISWAAALSPDGLLVCEEPVRYRSDDPLFVRYEAAVTAAVTAHGGTLWASAALDAEPPGCVRAVDRVVEHPVSETRAAAMFWRNAVSWGGDAELINALQAREEVTTEANIVWELRQTCWVRNPA